MSIPRILAVIGTRPEAIKMAPVILKLRSSTRFDVRICLTAQHREMVDGIMEMFGLQPDWDLQTMVKARGLPAITAHMLTGLDAVLSDFQPQRVLVHGDTTTTFSSALCAFYHRIPVAHVEAGLRTHDLYAPYPEEANRRMSAVLCDMHFAPTETARDHLLLEGIPETSIHVTGNTVIDALVWARDQLKKTPFDIGSLIPQDHPRLLLVTGHRRENFGEPLRNICQALRTLADSEDILIVYPMHLNPQVCDPVRNILGNHERILLLPPLDYLPFVALMMRAHLILTDSGGIQEEAPALGVPVLVMRDSTERPEAVAAGTVRLVGSDAERIVSETRTLLHDQAAYEKMSQAINPYGDGLASERILQVLLTS